MVLERKSTLVLERKSTLDFGLKTQPSHPWLFTLFSHCQLCWWWAERHSEQAWGGCVRAYLCVWMCVFAHVGGHSQAAGDLSLLLADMSSVSALGSPLNHFLHPLFLCTKILCLSSLVTFTKLSKCTLWLKWWQYFPCAPTLPSGGSCRAAERGAVRMKVKVWGTLQNSCLELWITKGLFFWSVTRSSATVSALYKKVWEEAGRTSLWEVLTITHCWG